MPRWSPICPHREILPVVERQDQPFALGNRVERSGDQVPLLPPITEFELVHLVFGRQMATGRDRSSATASEVSQLQDSCRAFDHRVLYG
jgi:hypothetical protein